MAEGTTAGVDTMGVDTTAGAGTVAAADITAVDTPDAVPTMGAVHVTLLLVITPPSRTTRTITAAQLKSPG